MRPAAWRYLMPLLVLPMVLMVALWLTLAQGRADGPALAQDEAGLNQSR